MHLLNSFLLKYTEFIMPYMLILVIDLFESVFYLSEGILKCLEK